MPGYSPACVCPVYFSLQVPPNSCWRGPLVSCGQQPTRLVERIPLLASCRPLPVWFQSPPADLTSCAIPSSREWPSSPYAHWDWRTGVCPVLNIVSVLLLLYRPFTMICLVVWLSGCLVVWLSGCLVGVSDFGSRAELPASWLHDPDQWAPHEASIEEVPLSITRSRLIELFSQSSDAFFDRSIDRLIG